MNLAKPPHRVLAASASAFHPSVEGVAVKGVSAVWAGGGRSWGDGKICKPSLKPAAYKKPLCQKDEWNYSVESVVPEVDCKSGSLALTRIATDGVGRKLN